MSNTTKLRITVTKEILEKAKYCDSQGDEAPTNCAVSLAIRDIFPDARVMQFGIFFFEEPGFFKGYDSRFSGKVISFIKQFEHLDAAARLSMPEITFDIEIPDWVIERINIDEIRPLLQNHPTLELIEQ